MDKSYTILDKLGQGSYGTVYLAKTEQNHQVAIKCCPFDKQGIPNLFELVIMKSLHHPNLMNAIDILVLDQVYIVEPLGLMDLHYYTSIYKNNHVCTIEELKNFFFSLLQAVTILHSQNIIHCDIKASNILLFNDGIKLSDFTLSTKMRGTHQVITPTHRPLEVWLK